MLKRSGTPTQLPLRRGKSQIKAFHPDHPVIAIRMPASGVASGKLIPPSAAYGRRARVGSSEGRRAGLSAKAECPGSLQPCGRKKRGTKGLEAKAAGLVMGVGHVLCRKTRADGEMARISEP